MVFCGLVTACRLATWPTSRSPLAGKPTTEGVVRAPSALGITLTSLAEVTEALSTTATQELVVPRSMPITFPIRGGAYIKPPQEPPPERQGVSWSSLLRAPPADPWRPQPSR